MDKDKENSAFDFDNDPEFNANFYKNIEKALENSDIPVSEPAQNPGMSTADEGEAAIETPAANAFAKEKQEDIPAAVESAAAISTAEVMPETGIEDELADINSSLAQQISAELDYAGVKNLQDKKHRWFKLQSTVAIALLCLAGFGFFFGFTKPGNHLLLDMGINIGGMIWASATNNYTDTSDATQDIDIIDEEDQSSTGKEIDPSTLVWPNNTGEGRKEEGVYNILLLGEEAIGMGSGRGRTDEIIIATLNTKTNSLKLTSLMRDQLVQIPGFKDNKLNAAYEEGGIDLLYQVIEKNFDVHIDGSVMVNFSNFEKIVDDLGGLPITLTAAEAKYLNHTNYISDSANRNVVEGTQIMNGNQVLGYTRVRKRAAITGKNNDYGRTDRHRIVLNAIFDKCKSLDKTQLASMILKYLPMITTDIDSKNFQVLADAYLKTGAKTIDQLRIPADGTFDDNAKVRGMSVLLPDYEKNISILHSFIFGDEAVDSTDNTTDTNTENTGAAGSADNPGN